MFDCIDEEDYDESFALLTIVHNPGVFLKCSERLRDDGKLARLAVALDADNFAHCSERLRNDHGMVRLAAITRDPADFELCSKDMDDDVLATVAIIRDPTIFKLCSERLRDDDTLAHIAFVLDAGNFAYCSARLRDNDVLAHKAVEAGHDYRDSQEIAISPDDFAYFKHCSERLRDDYEFALFAVNANPVSFAYCTERLRDDEELACISVGYDPINFPHCSERLRADPVLLGLAMLAAQDPARDSITTAERARRRTGDTTKLPADVQDAANMALALHGGNTPEARLDYYRAARAALDKRHEHASERPSSGHLDIRDIEDLSVLDPLFGTTVR